MTTTLDMVQRFAALTRGERGTGDRIANSDGYAFRIGLQSDDAYEVIRSLGIAETEYSLLTGLPPNSLRRMSARIKDGIRARKVTP